MILVTFNAQNRTLSITGGTETHGSPVEADLEGVGRTSLRGLKFGIKFFRNGVHLATEERPRVDEKFVASDQRVIATSPPLPWRPDDLVKIEAWLELGGARYDEALEFTAPRPAQPFPSWTWDADLRAWSAPEPYPDDGGDYEWDEGLGDWVAVV